MDFYKYPKITNTYDSKFMFFVCDMMKEGLFPDNWIVQEKIHGANFSIWSNGVSFKCAKRSRFIEKDEKFFNYELVINTIRDNIDRVYAVASAKVSIIICGELFGGVYDGVVSKVSAVQRGIMYHAEQQFLAFDLYVDGDLLGPLKALEIFRAAEMPYVEAMFKGSLSECLEIDNTFSSTIPAHYNLPELDKNLCEGVVIKPVHPVYLDTGERIIFKNKNESFSETQKIKHRPSAIPINVPDSLLELITENRLNNAISKLGDVTIKDFSAIIQEFTNDIFSEFLYKDANNSPIIEHKQVRKVVSSLAAKLIRKHFMQ